MSLTFIILIIGEHFFGIAGLLIWVSLFYFLAELLKDIDKAISKKHKLRKIEKRLLKRVKKTES
jgi:predicted PurR-regulated permease PerM